MRRVIDDRHYQEVSDKIYEILKSMPADEVSKTEYGLYRAQTNLIYHYILDRLENVKFAKNSHAHGIGNNNAIELVYIGEPDEEQICGYLHLNDDMYGSVYCYVTDYDGLRWDYPTRKVYGFNINNNYEREVLGDRRFGGWGDK